MGSTKNSPPHLVGRPAPLCGAGWGVASPDGSKEQLLTGWLASEESLRDRGLVHSPETHRARYLRNNMTKVERYVWSRLRNRQVGGYKFRRQVPVGPYFVDFLCVSARLAVEVDGAGHEQEQDERKTAWLKANGYRVLRFSDDADR